MDSNTLTFLSKLPTLSTVTLTSPSPSNTLYTLLFKPISTTACMEIVIIKASDYLIPWIGMIMETIIIALVYARMIIIIL